MHSHFETLAEHLNEELVGATLAVAPAIAPDDDEEQAALPEKREPIELASEIEEPDAAFEMPDDEADLLAESLAEVEALLGLMS